jgi:hypothetical protein
LGDGHIKSHVPKVLFQLADGRTLRLGLGEFGKLSVGLVLENLSMGLDLCLQLPHQSSGPGRARW